MSERPAAIEINGLSHRYGDHPALNDVSFNVAGESIFGLLGPNGGGKTTLFRILSTLLPVQSGSVTVSGFDVRAQPRAVRCQIGVTFQSPSLDGRLSVLENLRHQGHLYGLAGRGLRQRIEELLVQLNLADRLHDRADSLSGGLKRRVEIAKGLLHAPRLLLLDEPSTGLDPGARIDLWDYLRRLRTEQGMTILVTTHLMDEAERCDQLGILHRGRLVALDSPESLRASVGGDCLTIHCDRSPDVLSEKIQGRFGVKPRHVGDTLRIERPRGHELLRDVMDAFPEDVAGISLGKPTLEDVFIQRTGHRFWEEELQQTGEQEASAPR